MERNTFKQQRRHMQKRSSRKHLLQHWEDLKDRELRAQRHNKKLLQDFEEVQDTLREMFTLTAKMKTIRMEYERYLVERSSHRHQQLKITQAAQRKILKNPKDRKTMSSAHQPSPSHFSYNHDGNLHNPYLQSSWLMHPGVHNQTQDFSHMLPSRHSHAFQLHHLASMPSYSHPWPRQNVPDPASLQPDYPGLWTAGAARIPPVSAAQLYMTESPADRWMSRGEAEEAEVSSTASSKTGTNANRSPHLSQELDTKPVRLPCSAASGDSGQTSRKKRGRSRCTSSDRGRSSNNSSKTSSAIITAAVTVAQSSERGVSSEEVKTYMRRRTARHDVGLLRVNMAEKERNNEEKQENKDESQSTCEASKCKKANDGKHQRCKEEAGSKRKEKEDHIMIKNGYWSSSSYSSSEGIKDGESDEEVNSNENEDSGRDEEQQQRDVEDVSEKKNTREDKEKKTGVEGWMEQESEEEEDGVKNGDKRKKDSVDSEEGDEEESKGSEENGESDEEKPDGLKNEENLIENSECSQDEEADEEESNESEENESDEEKSDGLKNEENLVENSENFQEESKESDEESENGETDEGKSDGMKNEENPTESSETSQDEDESQEKIRDEQGEEEVAEEQKGSKTAQAEEESDSEDCIITPQNRSKMWHTIPEEASEDEEGGSKPGNPDNDPNELSDDDIEDLLAPQQRSQKREEKELNADEKPKGLSDRMEIFQVETEQRSTPVDQPSDSEEFDHFYD